MGFATKQSEVLIDCQQSYIFCAFNKLTKGRLITAVTKIEGPLGMQRQKVTSI